MKFQSKGPSLFFKKRVRCRKYLSMEEVNSSSAFFSINRGVYKLQDTDNPLCLTPRHLDVKDPRVDMYGLPGQHLIWPGEVILGHAKQHEVTTSGDPVKDNRPGSSEFANYFQWSGWVNRTTEYSITMMAVNGTADHYAV